jgi:peptidoglycan/xylan/chitin deacetylase (PgdA/CDA1 family)
MDVEQRRARREARRRERARRRTRGLAAVAALVAAIAAIAAAVLGSGGGASRPASSSTGGRTPSTGKPSGSGQGGGEARSGSGRRSGPIAGGGRADGIVTPAQASRRVRGGAPVPILMYHVINPPPAGAKFPGLYVPSAEFSEQMQALAKAGFRAVTMDQMLANWTHGAALPPGRPVVVSFDNGYLSQLTNALPVLRRLGWVGVENIQLTGLPPSQGGLSRAQVGELVSAGWELDTQGISHADLIALGPSALREQVVVARAELQRRYHVPVNWFCYPSGHYDAAVIAELKAAGYVGSTTVVPGWASPSGDPYRLPRLRVLGGTSGPELLSEIAAIRSNPPPPASYSGA